MHGELKVFVGPESVPELSRAVRAGGGTVTALEDAEAIVYYGSSDPEALAGMIHPRIRWIQLPHAGVEPWSDAGLITGSPVVTSVAGGYGPAVAEHALAMMLAAARRLPWCARATSWMPNVPTHGLAGRAVMVIGSGGIARALVPLLAGLGMNVATVGNRAIEGARRISRNRYRDALPSADYVVLAAPSTPATRGMIGRAELAIMRDDAWLLNVARGDLVDTNALVAALSRAAIGGAALDVTDPEPLPVGHPLWSLPNVLITPHCANTRESYWDGLTARVRQNVEIARSGALDALVGIVSPSRGY